MEVAVGVLYASASGSASTFVPQSCACTKHQTCTKTTGNTTAPLHHWTARFSYRGLLEPLCATLASLVGLTARPWSEFETAAFILCLCNPPHCRFGDSAVSNDVIAAAGTLMINDHIRYN